MRVRDRVIAAVRSLTRQTPQRYTRDDPTEYDASESESVGLFLEYPDQNDSSLLSTDTEEVVDPSMVSVDLNSLSMATAKHPALDKAIGSLEKELQILKEAHLDFVKEITQATNTLVFNSVNFQSIDDSEDKKAFKNELITYKKTCNQALIKAKLKPTIMKKVLTLISNVISAGMAIMLGASMGAMAGCCIAGLASGGTAAPLGMAAGAVTGGGLVAAAIATHSYRSGLFHAPSPVEKAVKGVCKAAEVMLRHRM